MVAGPGVRGGRRDRGATTHWQRSWSAANDLATVPRLSATVAEHSDAGLLVLDLTAVTFIDSTGVRALIEADRCCADSGSGLVVMAGDGPVRRMLDLCELGSRLTLATTHAASAA